MQQFLRRTLFDQHAKSDNCLLEIVRLGISRQFWFQPRIAYQLHENSKVDEDIFDELRQLKRKHPKKFICVYLNINSLRYKFCHICELLKIA
jgi:hypothetical protein